MPKPKPWERTKSLRRPVENRGAPKETLLIVCEGAKTEPNYFNSFRVRTATIKIVGAGDNTVNLVRLALKLRDAQESYGAPYDQVWCVFDCDDFPAQHINAAFELAKKEGISLAYSNEAFELWYLLHFNYYDAALSRSSYCARLSKLLGQPYQKNSQDIYETLKEKQDFALSNASKLLETYPAHQQIHVNNPSTTVHLLVRELNQFR